jgi:hypothetical protein
MKQTIIFLLAFYSQSLYAQANQWIYADGAATGVDYSIMQVGVEANSHLMILSFKVQDGVIAPTLVFDAQVKSVSSIKVEYQSLKGFYTVPVITSPDNRSMEVSLRSNLYQFMNVLKKYPAATFTINYIGEGPVKFTVPLTGANWGFLYE